MARKLARSFMTILARAGAAAGPLALAGLWLPGWLAARPRLLVVLLLGYHRLPARAPGASSRAGISAAMSGSAGSTEVPVINDAVIQ